MPINYERLRNWPFADVVQDYTERDCILYALGLGLGSRPTDPAHLAYTYEAGLRMFPTMAAVLAHPGFWLRDPETGVDWKKIVATGHSIVFHAAMPVRGRILGRMHVAGLYDKGADKGALLIYRRELFDAASGRKLCTVEGGNMLRGDGGFGGPRDAPPRPARPQGAPDVTIRIPTLPQAALIYRLSGDMNPLHADPAVAAGAGFGAPVLHGLCTYGIACRAVIEAAGAGRGALQSYSAEFAAPVFPGDELETAVWFGPGDACRFETRVTGQDRPVLTGGAARFGPLPQD